MIRERILHEKASFNQKYVIESYLKDFDEEKKFESNYFSMNKKLNAFFSLQMK